VPQEAADEVGHQVGSQRPAGAEIAEHPDEVRHAGEHHPAIGDGVGEIERPAIDHEVDVAVGAQLEAGRRDDDVGLQRLAGGQEDPGRGEPLDLARHHRGLAGADGLEEVPVRDEGDALAPRPVAGGEVLLHLLVADEGAHHVQQVLLHRLGTLDRGLGEGVLVVQGLAAHDLVDPVLADLQRAQGVGEVVGVAAGDEIGRRALQHGDMRAVAGEGRGQGRGRGARADDHHPLVLVVEIPRPGLRVHDRTLEVRHARPLGGVALGVPVVALAHPQEAGGEGRRLARLLDQRLDGPEVLLARPRRPLDQVSVADVRGQIVLRDHLAHVLEDLRGGGDRRSDPRLEAVAEGVEIAVGTDARILVCEPGAAKALQRLQHDKACSRSLVLEVIGAADAGYARADDQDIEVFRHALGPRRCDVDLSRGPPEKTIRSARWWVPPLGPDRRSA
jgi:hypothetical protein